MKASPASLSLIIPVRNGQHRIVARVTLALELLQKLAEEQKIRPHAEIILVDDGSNDSTVDLISAMSVRYPAIRVMRHGRPRGMESAGQFGLERSTGDLVMILEQDRDFRVEDIRQLIQMAGDDSIVAARAESSTIGATAPLMRRLRAWAGDADRHVAEVTTITSPIQMVRRQLMSKMAGPSRVPYRLHTESYETQTA